MLALSGRHGRAVAPDRPRADTFGTFGAPGEWLKPRTTNRSTVIVDARVFEEDFVPREVVHRHREVEQLTGTLEPVLDGERPDPAFLFGPTGVGKTCIARYALEELCERDPAIRTVYVNCWQRYTRFQVLYAVLEATGRAADVHRTTAKDEIFERLQAANERPTVVVLDEVDQLQETAALYDLHRLEHLAFVLIANREDELFAGLDDRVTSRFRAGERIPFDRYGTAALVDILEGRAQRGLEPGAVGDAQLEAIAEAAGGDARVAIGILHSAARRAQREGVDRVTGALLEGAIPEARTAIHRTTVEDLHEHQRALYDIVAETGEIAPGDLYDAYEDRVDRPKSKRTLRNYLNKMVHYDLIEAIGEKRGRTYRVPEGIELAPEA